MAVKTHDVKNPVTGEVIDSFVPADTQDVVEAVARARAAQPGWAALSYRDRARVLLRFRAWLVTDPDPIQDILQAEAGKSRRDTLIEVVVVAGTIRYYAYQGEQFLRPQRRRAAYPLVTGGHLHYKPLGVVGIIAPWNFPFILTIAEAVPALLAGNAVVIKPATLTPMSALWGARMLAKAGLPPGILQVLPGSGRTVGGALIDQADFIGFTGSTEVGRQVAARAAERLIPYSMELGGKNPMLVLDDLDDAGLDAAADNLLDGAFANCGQVCIAIERAYVMAPVYDAFLAKLRAKAEAVRLGVTRDYDTDVGSLISQEQLDTVQAHVNQAREMGAAVVAGGEPRPDMGPLFYAPTVLEGVTGAMDVAHEETFGPVVSVYKAHSLDAAIEAANDSPYGLNASVWTGSPARGMAVARRLESGTVNINDVNMIYNSFDLPMGGVKASGVGRRHSAYGIRKFTEQQAIVINRRALPWVGPVKLRIGAQQARRVLKLLRLWPKLPFLR